jgi:uncharacterized membrane protein
MRPLYLLPLSHHREDQAHRCVHLPLGGRKLALCARCLSLYPVMALALALQWTFSLGPAGKVDILIAMGLAIPGLLDWGEGVLDPRSGNNARRLITGAMLGVALGRSLWLHVQDPLGELLWIQLFLLAAGGVAFLIVRHIRPEGGGGI